MKRGEVEPIVTVAQFRRVIQQQLRASRPHLGAILNDAAAFCYHRGEHWPASRRGRWLVALRLTWQADDFLAIALYRLRTTLLDASFPVPILPKLLHLICAQLSGLRIGDWANIEGGVYVPHGQVVIDGLVKIGRGAFLCPWTTLGLVQGEIDGPTLGANVFVGTGAKILGKVTVGDGARIGANAVVLSDVPANATAVGVPARIVLTKPVEER